MHSWLVPLEPYLKSVFSYLWPQCVCGYSESSARALCAISRVYVFGHFKTICATVTLTRNQVKIQCSWLPYT